jgi:TRAP-type mannitol/chloroaromatic compound transport system substrate-binding protein
VSEKTRLRKRFEAMRAARFGIIKRIFWAFRKDPVMTRITRRTLARGGALGAAGALASAAAPALAAPAVAQSATLRWRMVTSWQKRLPGPGMSAERLAERIGALSGGRLDIVVSAAGEVVPAFGVLDAVGSGVAEMGHSAAFYWQGKEPAAAFFTTVPFGLLPNEHVAWMDAGGGQALWDELYAPFGVKPFMAGNTGVCMGGWFRREIKSRDDVRGLKIRSLGLGGEVYRRLGAIPQTTAPAEILVALQSGVIDGAEFVGPGSDIALGLYRYAPFYYGPGFNKPNGTGECIVNLKAWQGLDAELQAIVTSACGCGSLLCACRNGAAQYRGARRAHRQGQCAAAHLSVRSYRRGARNGQRCSGRTRRQERNRRQGERFLCGFRRQGCRLVAHFDASRVAGKAGLGHPTS